MSSSTWIWRVVGHRRVTKLLAKGDRLGWWSTSSEVDALVAQRTRASDYGSEGCGFESRRAHHKSPVQRVCLKIDLLGEMAMIAN